MKRPLISIPTSASPPLLASRYPLPAARRPLLPLMLHRASLQRGWVRHCFLPTTLALAEVTDTTRGTGRPCHLFSFEAVLGSKNLSPFLSSACVYPSRTSSASGSSCDSLQGSRLAVPQPRVRVVGQADHTGVLPLPRHLYRFRRSRPTGRPPELSRPKISSLSSTEPLIVAP